MQMRLTQWHARSITSRAHRASERGIDRTMHEAVLIAQERAPRDTGFMANTIAVLVPAQTRGGVTAGLWGNATAEYTLWQEIGSQGRPGRYFLRAGADAAYPRLAGAVAQAFKELG